MSELLTIDQAAAYLDITDDQVAAFVQDGELSYINMGRGKKRARYRFTIPDLQAFIEHRRRREVFCRSTKPNSRRIYHFDFQHRGHRFYGSTGCTTRKEAEAFEAVERDKAKALMKAMARSRTSLLIDDVAARLWDQSGQHDAEPDATSTNLARLIEYFGKTKPLTDIDHIAARKMVAWRRGHRVKGRARCAADLANATVNRSTTKVLQRLFTFAKAEGAVFEREPKWGELLLR